MRKILLFAMMAFALIIFNNKANAQLPDGSYGENFTMQDYLGTTYSLYDYLDAGKPVILDISATWCGPCWTYHTGGALESYYTSYGPSGDNSSMVFWIDGDESNLDCLQGISATCTNSYNSTQGDWTAGTNFPMILTSAPNNTQVVSDYAIGYFPTIYLICPNRSVTEVGQVTASALHTAALGCPVAGVNALDAAFWSAKEPSGSYCTASVTPEVFIQNYGSTVLTACNVVVKVDGATISTTPWTGSLAKYEIDEVVIPAVTGITDGAHTMTFEITAPNGGTDADASNNTLTNNFAIFSDGANVQVQLLTDNYPSETSWEIKDGSTVLASSDPFPDAQTTYNDYVCLEKEHCYDFVIYDEYGDGMSYGGVTGNVNILYNGNIIGTIAGDAFTTSGTVNFCTNAASIEENMASVNVSVFPNPMSASANIVFALNKSTTASFDVYNVLGEKVSSIEETTYSSGDHSITLNTESLTQGVYYLNCKIDNISSTKKITVVK